MRDPAVLRHIGPSKHILTSLSVKKKIHLIQARVKIKNSVFSIPKSIFNFPEVNS